MMRRVWCVAAVLFLGACSSSPAPSSSSASPSSASSSPSSVEGVTPAPAAAAPGASSAGTTSGAAAGDVALKADTKAICEQADRLGTSAGERFAADVKLLSGAEPDAVARVREQTGRDVQNYSDALVDMASLTSDEELKKVLSGMAKKVAAAKGDVRKLGAGKLAALGDELDKVCGK